MLIQILVDNKKSWIIPYAKKLVNNIYNNFKYDVKLIFNHNDVIKGDILILLSCEKVFKKLDLNKNNIVIHESNLPKGRGWSPLSWQVLENKKEIFVSLFEADKKIDAGEIYIQKKICLEGHELLNELKKKQGEMTISLILDFINEYPEIDSFKQEGKSSYYQKRTPSDSEIDINKTINDQFNLLRIVDNKRYPAFFIKNGKKYILKIYKGKI